MNRAKQIIAGAGNQRHFFFRSEGGSILGGWVARSEEECVKFAGGLLDQLIRDEIDCGDLQKCKCQEVSAEEFFEWLQGNGERLFHTDGDGDTRKGRPLIPPPCKVHNRPMTQTQQENGAWITYCTACEAEAYTGEMSAPYTGPYTGQSNFHPLHVRT